MRPFTSEVLTLFVLGQRNVCTTSLGFAPATRVRTFNRVMAYIGEDEDAIFRDAQSRNGQSQEVEQTEKTYFEGAGTLGDIMSDGNRLLQESSDQCEGGG